jgi:hypothetical protein
MMKRVLTKWILLGVFAGIAATAISAVKSKPINLTRTISPRQSTPEFISKKGSKDSQTFVKIKSVMDSLLQNSIKLVRTLENDSLRQNNETIKQVNYTLNGIKDKAHRFQVHLRESVQKPEEPETP